MFMYSKRIKHITVTVIGVLTILAAGLFLLCFEPYFVQWNARREDQQVAILFKNVSNNPKDSASLSKLIEAVKSSSSFKRTRAIDYLGQLGSNAAPAVDVLILIIDCPDSFNARSAALALGEIGAAARPALPVLMFAATNKINQDVGWFSAESLGRIATMNDTNVIQLLDKLASCGNQNMRNSAKNGLKWITGFNPDISSN